MRRTAALICAALGCLAIAADGPPPCPPEAYLTRPAGKPSPALPDDPFVPGGDTPYLHIHRGVPCRLSGPVGTPRVVRWYLTPPWRPAGVVLPGMVPADVDREFAAAWAAWAEVCGIVPVRVDREDGADVIHRGLPIDGWFDVAAFSDFPCMRWPGWPLAQVYDSTEFWWPAKLRTVAIHEIGHALGMSHLWGGSMAPYWPHQPDKPAAIDVRAATARYGPPVKAAGTNPRR